MGSSLGAAIPAIATMSWKTIKPRRRIYLLRKVLAEMGIEPERVRLEWISATEGARFAQVMAEFVEELKRLGPLHNGGQR